MEETVWDFLRFLKNPEEKPDAASTFLILNQPIMCEAGMIMSFWNKGVVRVLTDGGANWWLNFIKNNDCENLPLPDFITGDFDSVKPETKEFFENKNVNFISTWNQDETDFTKALRCIVDHIKKKNLTINLVLAVCENAGRLDQTIGNINTLHYSNKIFGDIPVLLISGQNITWTLRPGKHVIHVSEEYIQRHYTCGLMPLCGPTMVTTSGLKWNLDNQEMVVGGLISTSNQFESTEVKVDCNRDVLWTAEYCSRNS